MSTKCIVYSSSFGTQQVIDEHYMMLNRSAVHLFIYRWIWKM